MINTLIFFALLSYYAMQFYLNHLCKKEIILTLVEIIEEFKLTINCLCEFPTAIHIFEVRWQIE
jgi:hypothetical protein